MARAKTKTAAKRKKPKGRPTDYRPRYCQDILDYFDIEATIEKTKVITTKNGTEIQEPIKWAQTLPTVIGFARKLGISTNTLHVWRKKHAKFNDAYTRAKECQKDIWMQNSLLGLYNPHFAKFMGINMMDWRDKQEVEHSGEVDTKGLCQLFADVPQLIQLVHDRLNPLNVGQKRIEGG